MVERLKSVGAVSGRLYWLCQKELCPMSRADPNSITLKDPGRTVHKSSATRRPNDQPLLDEICIGRAERRFIDYRNLISSCAVSVRPNFCSCNSEKKMGGSGISCTGIRFQLPQHFLYFFPLPQGQGSFLPTFGSPFFFW